jgi:hypothetical protein
LVLDRVVKNDFSEGNFFFGRVVEQFFWLRFPV